MVVLDTSVIFKFINPNEDGYSTAQKILENHLSKKEKIIAPNLLFYEIANALATKSHISYKEAALGLDLLENWKLEYINLVLRDYKKTVEYSKKYKISVYDASYIVLAQNKNCDFITADQKLIEKVNLPFVKLL